MLELNTHDVQKILFAIYRSAPHDHLSAVRVWNDEDTRYQYLTTAVRRVLDRQPLFSTADDKMAAI